MAAPNRESTTTCTASTQLANCEILGFFAVGLTGPADQEPGALYTGHVGTIQVTELTDVRARGTFSLRLEDQDGGAGVEVRSGSFDVPLIPASSLSANRSPLGAASLNRVLSRR